MNNRLLNEIYQQKPLINDQSIEINSWWKNIDFHKKLNDQIDMEINQKVKIKSINASKKLDEKLVRLAFVLFYFLNYLYVYR